MIYAVLSIFALAAILDLFTTARAFDRRIEQARENAMRRRCPLPPYDLFGEIPVTWPEVWDWLEAVPRISRHSWRARYYLAWWNVPDKIRAAKRAGTYESITNRAPAP